MINEETMGKLIKKLLDELSELGYQCDVNVNEILTYLNAETPYQDLSPEVIMKNELLILHELAEICELKKMGLKITRDVIIKHHDKVYEAHLKATEVEFEMAKLKKQLNHIKMRLRDVKNWCEDPQLPHELKPRCKELFEYYAKEFNL